MAERITENVTKIADFEEDRIIHEGSRDALVAAGFAPSDVSFVSAPGKRGVRFINEQGRRVVITKSWITPGHYRLSEYLTAEEAAAKQHQIATRRRLGDLDQRLSRLGQPETEFREKAKAKLRIGLTPLLFMFFKRVGDLPTENTEAWSFDQDVYEKVRAFIHEMDDLIETAYLIRDEKMLKDLQRQRTALTDTGLQRFLAGVGRR